MEKVVLRQIGRNKWAGVTKYKNCFTYLGPYFTRTGSIYTGLDPENTKRLSELLGQDLTPTSAFWHNYFIKIGNNDVYIDPSTPRGELDYLFCKNHKRVAQSIDNINPSQDFVLIDANEEAKVISEHNKTRRQALKEFDKLSPQDRRRALRLYGFNPDSSSDEIVENRLMDLIEKDPKKFFDLWVDNKQRDTEYIVKQAIALSVMSRNKNVYKYGQDVVGHTLEDAVSYLDNPLNQDIKIAILKSIGNKKDS
jgi:hypothetical protein